MRTHQNQSGNVLFILMLAVILIAGLTAAITKSDRGMSNMDSEQGQIRGAKVTNFAIDLKRAVENQVRSGKSETTISFASSKLTGYGTPDSAAANEMFNIAGGGVGFVDVPENINNGSQWEFYGFTAAPLVGDDDVPDLMMVLPNVTQAFCTAYNKKAGFPENAAIPDDTSMCLHDTTKRFNGSFPTSSGDINTFDTATFPSTTQPYPAACVKCGTDYHAYYVLMER